MLHDTHVHLEMLLTKLGLLGDEREYVENPNEQILSQEVKNKLTELLADHEFLLQSTVSTANFQYVTNLFEGFNKIKYFLGSHPEIVNQSFDLSKYLKEQKHFLENHPEIKKGIYKIKIENSPLERTGTAGLSMESQDQKINSPLEGWQTKSDGVDSKQDKTTNHSKTQTIVGIGEVGLDYHYTQDTKLIQTQKELFESQIQLAIDYNLPLMIHCRDAFDDLFEILNKYPKIYSRFLIHCFTGGIDEMYKAVKLGGKIAFGGVITFKSAKNVQEAVEYCPLENFVLETDLPFLSPKRGETCIPEHIDLVAEKVAELKKIPKQKVWECSGKNCGELFRF
jgi:TatD DNase family protein